MSDTNDKQPAEGKGLSRRDQILQSLATLLEQVPGGRITTAGIAQHVGVSEAALYRHFPSKARMFEALIEYIETTIFPRINRILAIEETADRRCGKILELMLTFCELNPGFTRILTGEPLSGETERLRQRVTRFFDRVETQLRQIIREMPMRGEKEAAVDAAVAANLMLSVVEGKLSQYVRSDFTQKPTTGWSRQWEVISRGLF